MEQIDVETAAERMAQDDTVMLDIREAHEWAAGHIPGATHVAMSRLQQAHEAGEIHDGVAYLAMCRSGARSMQVTMALQRVGYDIVNVAGGMKAWQAAGLPMAAETGAPPQVIDP